ncbi:MAG: hypothetical protein P8P83_01315 [Rickettsiaceae bacterium]|nr:hypothetical protein [Rickettsiaceae bacterium]
MMAKTPNDIDKDIQILRNDLVGIKGYIASEFIKILTSHNGKINEKCENDLADAVTSLIYSDPKVVNSKESVKERNGAKLPVVSLTATEQEISEAIEKGKEANPDSVALYEDFENEVNKFKEELLDKTSTLEGQLELSSEKVQYKLIENSIQAFYTDNNNNMLDLPKEQKEKIAQKISNNINLSDEVIQSAYSNDKELNNKIKAFVSKKINTELGLKEGEYVIDPSLTSNKFSGLDDKFDKTFTSKFGKELNASPMILEAISVVHQKHPNIVNKSDKVIEFLAPGIADLQRECPKYVKNHKEQIVSTLSNDLTNGKTLVSTAKKLLFRLEDYSIAGSSLERINNSIKALSNSPEAKAEIADRESRSSEREQSPSRDRANERTRSLRSALDPAENRDSSRSISPAGKTPSVKIARSMRPTLNPMLAKNRDSSRSVSPPGQTPAVKRQNKKPLGISI